jgi:hypothetical protein
MTRSVSTVATSAAGSATVTPAVYTTQPIYVRTFDVIYGRARPIIYNAPTGARTYAVIMGRTFDVIYGRPFPGSL